MCGVRTSDGIYVAAAGGFGFVVPLLLNITFYGVPGSLIFSVVGVFTSVCFFNWARKNHPPKWMEQALAYSLREYFGAGNDLRRARVGRAKINWILDYTEVGEQKKLWLKTNRE